MTSSFPTFPSSPNNGDTVPFNNVTYTWREVDGHPDGGFWKAKVYYYDLSELDSDYVNVIGDVMSDTTDIDYPLGHPYDPGILEYGKEFPGTAPDPDNLSTSKTISFFGNQRLDVRPKLVNENNIVLQDFDDSGTVVNYTITITGDSYFNKTVEVYTNSVVKNTEGRVTYTHQWQSVIIDQVFDYTDTNKIPYTPPTDSSPWVDITGETNDYLKCRPTTLNYDPMDSPDKLVFVRCIETVTDRRGSTYSLTNLKSNTLGPFTFKP